MLEPQLQMGRWSVDIPYADVDAAALHVAGKGRKRRVAASIAAALLAIGGAASALSAAPAAAAQRLFQRLVCEYARHAMVAAPRRPAEHHSIAAAGCREGSTACEQAVPHHQAWRSGTPRKPLLAPQQQQQQRQSPAQQQRGGRHVLAVRAHQEDGGAAQRQADQRLVQAALRVVNVAVERVAWRGWGRKGLVPSRSRKVSK